MPITVLIIKLQELLAKHGDVECWLLDDGCFKIIPDPEVIEANCLGPVDSYVTF